MAASIKDVPPVERKVALVPPSAVTDVPSIVSAALLVKFILLKTLIEFES